MHFDSGVIHLAFLGTITQEQGQLGYNAWDGAQPRKTMHQITLEKSFSLICMMAILIGKSKFQHSVALKSSDTLLVV